MRSFLIVSFIAGVMIDEFSLEINQLHLKKIYITQGKFTPFRIIL